ncbi:MAG: molybdopterin dinucleotide binding domain-containing protein, partial [Actinomycetota bacterium]
LDSADAAVRGIGNGDRVRVWNDRGSLEMVARVRSAEERRVRPGVVSVPFGWVGDRTADGRTVNGLTNDRAADHGGGVAFYDTLVEVSKI